MKTIPKNFMAIDLELNQPSRLIIQVGAVIGDIHTGEIFDEIDLLVKPSVDVGRIIQGEPNFDQIESIHPDIVKLTAITDEMIKERGMDLEDAYEILAQKHAEYACARSPIVWGGGDSIILRRELESRGQIFSDGYGDKDKSYPEYIFGFTFLDTKTLYQTWRIMQGKAWQGGLAKALTKIGLAFEGRKHTATADAHNTFVIFRKLAEPYDGKILFVGHRGN